MPFAVRTNRRAIDPPFSATESGSISFGTFLEYSHRNELWSWIVDGGMPTSYNLITFLEDQVLNLYTTFLTDMRNISAEILFTAHDMLSFKVAKFGTPLKYSLGSNIPTEKCLMGLNLRSGEDTELEKNGGLGKKW
ncbi:hypothetical protein AVEN_89092-1 [Araneus ventricosus]|uniref:Uncharacterized protein n=1 Tax=Araneus ventricosus TaxID=182803 RepID=A0A4Y2B414_ARAVE|nr:hypothetical protein AVEN_89092-1 [Araneus ventricosus]